MRSFFERRFGVELASAIVEPLIGGIYGDDTGRLSLAACLPRLRGFEREHRSVLLGVQRAVRARRRRVRAGERVLPPTVTLERGMASLPEALARQLGECIRLGVAARRITRGPGAMFRVETTAGTIACDGVVVATPTWQAPPLVETLSLDLAADLAAVNHKVLDCVTFAWARPDVPHALEATGWVRASGDRRATLACSWASRKWPGRAPDGFVLFRSVLAIPAAGERELVEAARADLRDLVGVTAPPCLVRVRRLARATPIYEVGHRDRVARIAERVNTLGAFALAGNAYEGVGVPACVASGESAGRAISGALAELRARS